MTSASSSSRSSFTLWAVGADNALAIYNTQTEVPMSLAEIWRSVLNRCPAASAKRVLSVFTDELYFRSTALSRSKVSASQALR